MCPSHSLGEETEAQGAEHLSAGPEIAGVQPMAARPSPRSMALPCPAVPLRVPGLPRCWAGLSLFSGSFSREPPQGCFQGQDLSSQGPSRGHSPSCASSLQDGDRGPARHPRQAASTAQGTTGPHTHGLQGGHSQSWARQRRRGSEASPSEWGQPLVMSSLTPLLVT